MAVTASELRANIYRLLHEVLDTGEPLVVEHKDKRLRIVPDDPRPRLERLPPRAGNIVGDSGVLIHIAPYTTPSPSSTAIRSSSAPVSRCTARMVIL